MSFSFWQALLGIPLTWLCFSFFYKQSLPPTLTYPQTLEQPMGLSYDPIQRSTWLRLVGLTFLWLALARPQTIQERVKRNVDAIDIMIALDISPSMNITDLSIQSRLEVAKQTVASFVLGRRDDRLGLVIFSGEAFTSVPLTFDTHMLLQILKTLSTNMLPQGTAIGDGLALALSRLQESTSKNKVIILLTDGDNTLGKVDPETAGQMAQGYGVKIYTIAIGVDGIVSMPVQMQTPFGQTITQMQQVKSDINPELLKKLAQMTNGKFYRATDASTLTNVFKDINALETTTMQKSEQIKFAEHYLWPLLLGLCCFLLEKLFSLKRWRVVP